MLLPNEPGERPPAIFLDRDGTIMTDVNYCGDPRQVKIFAGTGPALERLKGAGFKLFVITNQSGIGRGYFTEQDYRAVEKEVIRQVGAGLIDAIYFCPDHPDAASDRRKPGAGMVFEAERDHGLDLARSFMIGDKFIDIECGRRAGLRTILVGAAADKPPSGATWEVCDFPQAAEVILRHA